MKGNVGMAVVLSPSPSVAQESSLSVLIPRLIEFRQHDCRDLSFACNSPYNLMYVT